MHALAAAYTTIDALRPDRNRNKLRFRFWHVEDLINQATIIVERVLKDRQDLQALEARKANIALEVFTAKAEIERETARIAEGYYKVRHEAVELVANHLQRAIGAHQQATDNEPHSPLKMAYLAQLENYKGQYASSKVEEASALREAKNNVQEAQSRISRAAKLIEFAETKNGPFDFDSQIAATQRRLVRDFRDAVDRASVAAEGISLIYDGLGVDGGIADFDGIFEEGQLDHVDALALWLREAVRLLAALTQREQVISVVMSLRHFAGNDWAHIEEHLASSGWSELSFRIRPEVLPPHTLGRLRGISASTVGTSSPWSMMVRPPERAVTIVEPDGDTAAIDQSDMPWCFIGHVEPETSPRELEIAGTVSLMNASPIGAADEMPGSEWRVVLSHENLRSSSVKEDVPRDVFVTLLVAMISGSRRD